MLVLGAKVEGTKEQYKKLNEAIRTARFVRNICLRYWMHNKNIGKYELSAYCAVLASQFELAKNLNSMAGQARAERAGSAILAFMTTAIRTNQGKRGILGSQNNKHMVLLSTKPVDGSFPKWRYITFSDCLKAGTFKRWGTCDLHFYQ
jgi:putative transposase